ncbi:MAG: Glutamate-1-semialdehyde 2,1-aminomutase [uncultured Chloroflexi bacterium]|uniref:Glutamate-1-semialdehyde 2,1-aminomutase n=1 Tax=uncultured Chloroflexota bacterium TaxID=166587 RepID=A0A6J4IHZ0_9CHLR|nr:MAG: Glutamate-1-semialdehyde 2,1-aminomutase [uncultured Chloroflexota bacterium]
MTANLHAPTPTRNYSASVELHREASDVLAGGVNSNFRMGGQPAPLFFDRAEGPYLYDVDGNRYVDYVLGMGPNILGHAHPKVVQAVAGTLEKGVLYAGQHRDEVELALRFCAMVPCADQVRFGSSGSEMDQAALRMARAATGGRLVVKFEGHYHGWFDTILVSVHPPLDEAGPEEAPVPHLPTQGQSAAAAQDVAVLPWNDLGVVKRFLTQHAHETAALIMEPILCNTCVVMPAPGYLEGVRALCDRHGVVLIFDEVITGFRVAPGGAQELLGVTPDLAVYAKALGGGFPIAAVAGKRQYMELLGTGAVLHGGSYNTNLVSTAAALATLEELASDGGASYGQMEARGQRLIDGLRELGRRAELPLHVQGLPGAFNTCFTSEQGEPDITSYRDYARRTDAGLQRRLLKALQDQGVRVTSRGTWFMSTVHDEAQIDDTLAAAEAALAEVSAE